MNADMKMLFTDTGFDELTPDKNPHHTKKPTKVSPHMREMIQKHLPVWPRSDYRYNRYSSPRKAT